MSLHHVRAREWKGDLVLLHEVADGAADRSYGIAVAKLAGLPPRVVARAKSVLAKLEAGRDACATDVAKLAAHASSLGSFVWLDMEESHYVDATMGIFREVRASYANVGLCLQAYLHRTPMDLETLLPLQPAIRLVKGAYWDSEIKAALATLPEGFRTVVYYADVQGYTYAETAALLNIPMGTVMSRVSRGRQRLRIAPAHLAPNGGDFAAVEPRIA